MKKAAILILALLLAFIFVGCNVAPNIPSVTPYPTTTVTPYTTARVSPYTTTPGYDTTDKYRYGYNGYDYNTTAQIP